MGHPEQFAKQTFARETERVTGGALTWQDPPEIGLVKLVKVQGDGLLLVRRPELLTGLSAPWSAALGYVLVLVELKMPGDHLDLLALERAVLRQQALRVQRLEGKTTPPGAVPLWLTAPHVPEWLGRERPLRCVGPGCYAVGPPWSPVLWIAANELPLRLELVPFLVARSGKALDEFAMWVAPQKSVDWVMAMIQYTAMSDEVTEELLRRTFTRAEDPEIEARRRLIRRVLIETTPGLTEELMTQGGLRAARADLHRVLARRRLPVTPDQHERIEQCSDPATLERWHDQAITAASAAEALQ